MANNEIEGLAFTPFNLKTGLPNPPDGYRYVTVEENNSVKYVINEDGKFLIAPIEQE